MEYIELICYSFIFKTGIYFPSKYILIKHLMFLINLF